MHRPSTSSPSSTQGFALVIALSLMAFVLLLLLSITTLVQVETRSSEAQASITHARANALLALNIALGELQKHAGPDQRISARAEILDTDASTETIDGVNQPQWTGIWETGSEHLDVGSNPQRTISLGALTPSADQKASSAHWLVSQDPNSAATANPIAGPTGATVIVAKQIGQTATDVTVPLVPTDNANSSGAYGYWISDEGVKAKATLEDPTFESTDQAINQLHHWVPHANAMHQIFPMLNSDDDFRNTSTEELEKLSTTESLALLTTVDPTLIPKEHILDFTPYSQGVLSDVRRGGLKKDLTAIFEDEANFQTFADAYGQGLSLLYRSSLDGYPAVTAPAQAGQQINRPDGMLWHALYHHYNLYKSDSPAGESTSRTANGIGDANGTLPYTTSPRAYMTELTDGDGNTANVRFGTLLPEVISYRVDAAISSYFDGTNWKLRMHYYPQLVLYNPYSVRLSATDFKLERRLNLWASEEVTITVAGTAVPAFNINQGPYGGRLQLITKAGQTDLLQPGETRVYGITSDSAKSDMQEAITFSELESAPGTSADFSQTVDVPGFTGTPTDIEIVSIQLSKLTENRANVAEMFITPSTTSWPTGGGRLLQAGNHPGSTTTNNWVDREISTMTSPIHLKGVFVRHKGIQASGSNQALSYENATEAPPIFMANSSAKYGAINTISEKNYEIYTVPFGGIYQTGINDLQIQPALNGTSWETSYGQRSAGFDTPGNRYILQDLPSQPMVSLGQFMHMLPYFYVNDSRAYNTLTHGSMTIGGSYAHSLIPTDAIGRHSDNNGYLLLDDSFLANQALFDRFFFSTVPPAGQAPSGTSWPQAWTNFNAENSGTDLNDAKPPLLNSRITPRTDRVVTLADLRDTDKAAANLLLDGAFNVNSTSVAAWKAFLGGLSGNTLRLYDASTGSTSTVDPGDDLLIPRFWSATGDSTINAAWSGLRALDQGQLTELAARIVEQVKTRGPFLSMADFLNRRQGSNHSLTRSGALQAAIDSTSPDINATVKALGQNIVITNPLDRSSSLNVISTLADANHFGFKDSDGDDLTTATGMPGYLMQQDLVQNYSAAMTVRSDTFVIRCYGEHRNQIAGTVQGKAWGEAVVQRIPDYFDPTNAPETAVDNLFSPDNQTFGRRFVLRSFRWLTEDEI